VIAAVNGDQGLGRIISPIKGAMRSSNLDEEVRMKRKGMAAWKGFAITGVHLDVVDGRLEDAAGGS
jgi:hypothetical protein